MLKKSDYPEYASQIKIFFFPRKELGNVAGNLASGLDSFYLLFAGALVFFMQLGFAMVRLRF
jgi:hypothetical protein